MFMKLGTGLKALKNRFYFALVSALSLLVPLFGCTNYEGANVRVTENGEYPFMMQLRLQYGELALRKNVEDNTASATHFAEKAARAAIGQTVTPDLPDDDESGRAYDRLSGALRSANPATMPAERARAQVMYDCWLEERAQAVDADDIAACGQQFERALLALSGEVRGQARQ